MVVLDLLNPSVSAVRAHPFQFLCLDFVPSVDLKLDGTTENITDEQIGNDDVSVIECGQNQNYI